MKSATNDRSIRSENAHEPIDYLEHTARARKAQGEAIVRSIRLIGNFISRSLAKGWKRIDLGIRRRQMVAELSALDDRILDDIGIRRRDIPMVVDGLLIPGGDIPIWNIRSRLGHPQIPEEAANESDRPAA
ncbi:DUF1127 domain-containing protein [Thioalkalivibrio sp. HK1]|uniref:DUF1127 domain-containing protein n=1 Tax=Thioalkalivibrio sp. HK1 TaxID=1469245 RepID=UPI0004726301|nr:DUF1127 domain-containing protein [Thioalkalivibrio sp. HK1]